MAQVLNPNPDHFEVFKEAFTILQESRRAIAWSYPLQYFLKKVAKKQYLAFQQNEIVHIIEAVTKQVIPDNFEELFATFKDESEYLSKAYFSYK